MVRKRRYTTRIADRGRRRLRARPLPTGFTIAELAQRAGLTPAYRRRRRRRTKRKHGSACRSCPGSSSR